MTGAAIISIVSGALTTTGVPDLVY